MSQEVLLKALEEEALSKRESIIDEAKEEAGEVIRQATERADGAKRGELALLQELLDRDRAFGINTARLEGRGELLKLRRTLIGEVYLKVDDYVSSLPDDDRRELVLAFAGELLDNYDSSGLCEARLYCNPDDEELLSVVAAERGVELVPDGEVGLGAVIIVRYEGGGTARYENTYLSRLEAAREELDVAINDLLFGSLNKEDTSAEA